MGKERRPHSLAAGKGVSLLSLDAKYLPHSGAETINRCNSWSSSPQLFCTPSPNIHMCPCICWLSLTFLHFCFLYTFSVMHIWCVCVCLGVWGRSHTPGEDEWFREPELHSRKGFILLNKEDICFLLYIYTHITYLCICVSMSLSMFYVCSYVSLYVCMYLYIYLSIHLNFLSGYYLYYWPPPL